MKYLSPVYSQASGAIAGIVYSHNRGGQYTRARTTPTDPSTAGQNAVRLAMSNAVARWGNTLTPSQRQAWETYAANVPVLDRLGQQIFLTGQQQYNRTNVFGQRIGSAWIDAAPTTFDVGQFTAPVLSAAGGFAQVSLAFTDTDDWANEDDAFLGYFQGIPQNGSRNYYGGPYRFAATVDGDATTPPTSPAAISIPYMITTGQKVFGYCRVLRADGRLSARFPVSTLAA